MTIRGTPIRNVALGWSLFTGTHLAMSHPPVREKIIEKLGDGPFKGVYSAVALATFLPTTYIYARHAAGKGAIPGWTSFTRSRVAKVLGTGAKGLGAIGFGQALAAPSPVADTGHGKQVEVEVKGLNRITRHGMFSSLALLGLGNLLTRGHAGDVVYWAGYPVMYLVGCAHQDMRLRAELPQEFFEQTSLLPFQAVWEGRNSLTEAVKELDKPALVTALVAPLFFL